MKKWITQTSTIFGLVMLVVGALQAYKTGGDWVTVAIGVISGLAMLIKDGALNGSGTALVLLIGIVVASTSCGASIEDLQISDEQKISIAVEAGCAAAATEGCFADADVQTLLGDLKTSEQCISAVTNAISEKSVTVDVAELVSKVFTCKKFLKALGWK